MNTVIVREQYLVVLKDLMTITLKQIYAKMLPKEDITVPQHPLQLWGKLYYHASRQLQVTSKVLLDLELRSTIQFGYADKEDLMQSSDDHTPISISEAAKLVIDKVTSLVGDKPEYLSDILLELQHAYWSNIADQSNEGKLYDPEFDIRICREPDCEDPQITTLEKLMLQHIPGFIDEVTESVRPHVETALKMTSDIFPDSEPVGGSSVSTLMPVFLRAVYASLKHNDPETFYSNQNHRLEDPGQVELEGF